MAIVVRPCTRLSSASLNLALGFGVDRGGRLVEDQDPRIDQQRPGDRDPLPLAARERLTSFADQRVVAQRAAAG